MTLRKMFALKPDTEINGKKPELPYQFAAADELQAGKTNFKCIVDIVMPLGGSQSALFRYPKYGEKVLVGIEEENSFLMGYLPDNPKDNIYTGPEKNNKDTYEQILPEEMAGEFLRYKGPNDYIKKTITPYKPTDEEQRILAYEEGTPLPLWWKSRSSGLGLVTEQEMLQALLKEKQKIEGKLIEKKKEEEEKNRREEAKLKTTVSEIGFYHEKTAWETKDKEKYKDIGNDNKPKITTLNIKSTGDTHQDTKNHHRTRAKRFELLVDCRGETDKENVEDGFAFGDDGDSPYGDQSGDDSNLYRGDAHIRAKNRVVIKAEKEIELRVGRSSIVVSDEGIFISSRKTRSNVRNGWDTVLELNPVNGISMFGQKVFITAGNKFDLSELYGGSISSRLGVTRIQGFDIRLATTGLIYFLEKGIANGLDFVTNLVTTSTGASKTGGPMGSLGSMTSVMGLRIGGGAIAGMTGSSKNLGKYDPVDKYNIFVGQINNILMIIPMVGMVIEMLIPEKIKREESRARDVLYTTLALAEYGVLLTGFGLITASCVMYTIFESVLHLSCEAEITMDAGKINALSLQEKIFNSVTAGLDTTSVKDFVKGGWNELVEKLKKIFTSPKMLGIGAGAILGGAGLGTGVGLVKGLVTMPSDAELEEELRSL